MVDPSSLFVGILLIAFSILIALFGLFFIILGFELGTLLGIIVVSGIFGIILYATAGFVLYNGVALFRGGIT